MGNAASDVTNAVKKQAEGDSGANKMYQLVDAKGGGMLVDLAKQASATKNFTALDEAIKQRVEPMLYNKGAGKLIHVSRIALMRNRDRSKQKHIFKNEADFDKYKEPEDCKDPKMYKECCWDLDERGAVGETALHLCLLNATAIHAELCKRLVMFYPKLVVDVYMNDEYYGESVLHIAIVNEDPGMVKFLLEIGANPSERCFGSFMSPEDQKASRNDVLDSEFVTCDPNTNYKGYVYWGEYPASFAACLGMEECYRMILAKGADPNAQDGNGNTVLHLLVIQDKKAGFSVAYELGADIHIRNNLNLTPLTLAAKIARKEVFFHIINISREIYWQIGSVTCAAYPLSELDTIDSKTGGIQKESALNLIVFGETIMHLELMEGPVIDLLVTKWNAFVKARFYRQFILFALFFLISLSAFVLRPIHTFGHNLKSGRNSTGMGNATTFLIPNVGNVSFSPNFSSLAYAYGNFSAELLLEMDMNGTRNFSDLFFNDNGSLLDLGDGNNTAAEFGSCFDKIETTREKIVALLDLLSFLGSIAYLLGAGRECHFLGSSMFFENLATAPARVLFLFSRIMYLVMAAMRLFCLKEMEDLLAVIVMLTTAPYFLFFCRGFKTVGPFVTMIYRMITGDLLRFVIIYLVFVIGFSQAYFIIFLSYNNPDKVNPLGSPAESIMAMFLMSLLSFDQTYEAFAYTDHEMIAKLLFVIYMAIVAILLINMLIAMMGNTYTKIAETKNEWQRQWARIVLVVERGVSPAERHAQQELYSQPMSDMSRALVLRLNQSEDEKEEMKELLDIRRYHDKSLLKRQNKTLAESGISVGPQPRHSIVNTLMPGGGNI